MNLGFKTELADRPTYFPGLILQCAEVEMLSPKYEMMLAAVEMMKLPPKIHTLREDEGDRWQPGRAIHFCTGVRTSDYCQFGKGVCRSVQRVTMCVGGNGGLMVAIHPDKPGDIPNVLNDKELLDFARNDGFPDVTTFTAWFKPAVIAAPNQHKDYKLIHWTAFRYSVPKRKNRRPANQKA